MKYISTRDAKAQPKGFEEILLSGLADDGGLYMPLSYPKLDIQSLKGKSYPEVAHAVMAPFVGDALTSDELRTIINDTYAGDAFDHKSIAPLRQLGSNLWMMELFHGSTIAFKDVALQMLGRLFDYILERKNQRITIVGATSGDTGSAAIEACKACRHIDIFILHPRGRVSEVQRRQMTTVLSDNVHNIAIEGTFDDCQALVKAMFADRKFAKDMRLSAVNSINWARIMAQIVYYVSASVSLNDKTDFCVPTGNFGNVLAAWVAKQMGANIGRLHIATNKNDILDRFFKSGVMECEKTMPSLSPSMDIQISSNFERYLFEALGRDAAALDKTMDEFSKTRRFNLSQNALKRAQQDFTTHKADDEKTISTMQKCYRETGIIIDPHTAVGLAGAYEEENRKTPMVSLACAHAAKFPDAVEKAIGVRPPLPAHLSDLLDRPERMSQLPNDLKMAQDFVRSK